MKRRLRIPGEWEPHEACWLAFPYRPEEWPLDLAGAQRSIAELCRAIAGPGNEPVRLLVRNQEMKRHAGSLIGDVSNVEYVIAEYGDCWLRDTAPLLGLLDEGELGGLRFELNGWGGKYEIPLDDRVGPWMLHRLGAEDCHSSLTLEGGALESNGRGTVLTTASCTLNDNRNPGLTREQFESALGELLSLDRVVWLDRGLAHDHTDGHVDMVARFVDERSVLCMDPAPGYPNGPVLASIRDQLRAAGLLVRDLPTPPEIRAPDGSLLPGTYCNFYVANEAVIVPTYGVVEDERALAAVHEAFEGRETIGLPALDLLCGGGAFHCVTQPQPMS